MYSKFIFSALFLGALFSCNQNPKTESTVNSTEDSTKIIQGENTVLMGGKPISTYAKLPAINEMAPNFTLTDMEMNDQNLESFKGKFVILNIFPSVDTEVCSASVRHFNEDAANLPNTVVLCISKDLPFAQKRFCGAEGIKNVVMLSDYRSDFGKIYGVEITDSKMKGLLSRAVVVINSEGKIIYQEQVADISKEPNYEAAMKAVKI